MARKSHPRWKFKLLLAVITGLVGTYLGSSPSFRSEIEEEMERTLERLMELWDPAQ